MTLFSVIDDDVSDGSDIATNTGWREFCEWARESGNPDLAGFADSGKCVGDCSQIANAIGDLLDSNPPNEDVTDVARGVITDLMRASDSLVITDGFGDADIELGYEDQPRASDGKWTAGGGGGNSAAQPLSKDDANDLRGFMEQMRGYKSQNFAGLKDFKFKGMEDLILNEGQEFKNVVWPRPDGVEKGPDKECFKNAAQLALFSKDYTYAEGFATTKGVPFPIHHAWVVDRDNNVVETTWKSPGTSYVGVKLTDEFLANNQLETQMYGVFGDNFRNIGLYKDGLPKDALVLSMTTTLPDGVSLAYCPTGTGGGVDPTCSPHTSGGEVSGEAKSRLAQLRREKRDTQSYYKGPDGKYENTRQAFHDRVVAETLAKGQITGEKTVMMMGGGMAAGKTSMIEAGHVKPPEGAVIVSADDMKAFIPEYREGIANHEKDAGIISHEESSDMAKELMAAALAKGYPIVFDSTGDSTLEKVLDKTNTIRAAGYKVEANYVTRDISRSQKQNEKRFERTGRYVMPSVLEQSHRAVADIFPKAVAAGAFDKASVWDRSEKKNPTMFMSTEGTKVTVHNEAMAHKFAQRAIDGD